jgi:hypothetical protein
MRKYPGQDGSLQIKRGEYGKEPRTGTWYACPPTDDQLLGNLGNHQVIEHEDGTITVSPSILISGYDGDRDISWHGFFERGVWREV